MTCLAFVNNFEYHLDWIVPIVFCVMFDKCLNKDACCLYWYCYAPCSHTKMCFLSVGRRDIAQLM